jgi:hypothetical protein
VVKGLIPSNEALRLTVYGECGTLFTKNIGPFTAKATLGKTTVTDTSPYHIDRHYERLQ